MAVHLLSLPSEEVVEASLMLYCLILVLVLVLEEVS